MMIQKQMCVLRDIVVPIANTDNTKTKVELSIQPSKYSVAGNPNNKPTKKAVNK